MVAWPCALGQNIMVVGVCGGGASLSMVDRNQKKRQEGARDKIPPKTHPPVTHFFQLGPT
jgi:hypothetical protein